MKYVILQVNYFSFKNSKSFTIDEDKTIEGFVSELNEDKPLIENEFRLGIIKELSKSSPHGKVYKFYSVKSTDLRKPITISETIKELV